MFATQTGRRGQTETGGGGGVWTGSGGGTTENKTAESNRSIHKPLTSERTTALLTGEAKRFQLWAQNDNSYTFF